MQYRKPNRLKYYDYSTAGWYYVTICTKDYINQFGIIKNEKMIFNDIGIIAERILKEIPKHYPEVELDYFQIMPNPIIINNNVEERHASPPQKHTLGNIIGSFKSAVTKSANQYNKNNFRWQRSFYERIIRNEKELYNIRKYILQNPIKWDFDKGIENIEM